MIRLRNKNGDIIPLPENLGFVEVCSTTGEVACAVYPDSNKFIHIVTTHSLEARRYEDLFSVKFTPIISVPSELKN